MFIFFIINTYKYLSMNLPSEEINDYIIYYFSVIALRE